MCTRAPIPRRADLPPANRVSRSGHRPPDGLPGVEVAFEYSAQNIESILRAHAVLGKQLRASGRGSLTYHDHEADRFASVRAQAVDGYRQIGSTRMSEQRLSN